MSVLNMMDCMLYGFVILKVIVYSELVVVTAVTEALYLSKFYVVVMEESDATLKLVISVDAKLDGDTRICGLHVRLTTVSGSHVSGRVITTLSNLAYGDRGVNFS